MHFLVEYYKLKAVICNIEYVMCVSRKIHEMKNDEY
jgi:hypothetical protein